MGGAMTNKKFEFVQDDEIVLDGGKKLRRIRALVDFGGILAGSLGGYLEKDSSLATSGDAWVSDIAHVIWFTNVGSDRGTLTAYKSKNSSIELTRGCFIGDVDAFLAASEKKHDAKTNLEYILLVEVAVSRLMGAAA